MASVSSASGMSCSFRWYSAHAESHGLMPRMTGMSVAVIPRRRAASHSGVPGVTSTSSGMEGHAIRAGAAALVVVVAGCCRDGLRGGVLDHHTKQLGHVGLKEDDGA